MSVAHTLNFSLVRNGFQISSGSYTETQTAEFNYDAQLAASQTNHAVPATITHADIKSVFMLSDTALTIKTNSATVPTDTLVLAAGVPVLWDASMPATNCPCPITADVTGGFFLTNGATASNVKIYICLAS